MLSAIEYYGENLYDFASVAAPGFWNDPDMVRVIRICPPEHQLYYISNLHCTRFTLFSGNF